MLLFKRLTNTELDKWPSFAKAINFTEQEASNNILTFCLELLRP
jgi:hypothetical protein